MKALLPSTRSLAIASLWCALAGPAWSQAGLTGSAGLTPARYFECQISARYATLVGMEERLGLLNSGTASASDRNAASERSRARVSQSFASCGYSAGALGAYANRNADGLATWLAENPAVQARLEAMGQRVAALAARFPDTNTQPAPAR